ncbi:MAG: helix-turn-helix domain-containing protein [Actinomycetota bacterium]|nr:helix-turn-helix domain-containing protein [Actinomycetota bacterium]
MSRTEKPVADVFVSMEQAAQRLSVSRRTVRNRISDGSLHPYRMRNSRAIRLRLADVDALLVAFPTGGGNDA